MAYQNKSELEAFSYTKGEIDRRLRNQQGEFPYPQFATFEGTETFTSTNTTSYRTFPVMPLIHGRNWQRWLFPRSVGGGFDLNNFQGGEGILQITVYASLTGLSPVIPAYGVALVHHVNVPSNTFIVRPTGTTAPNQATGAMSSTCIVKVANGDTIWGGVNTGSITRTVGLYYVDIMLIDEGF